MDVLFRRWMSSQAVSACQKKGSSEAVRVRYRPYRGAEMARSCQDGSAADVVLVRLASESRPATAAWIFIAVERDSCVLGKSENEVKIGGLLSLRLCQGRGHRRDGRSRDKQLQLHQRSVVESQLEDASGSTCCCWRNESP
ncbi:hypothetical protein V7S43_010435 [Phytophthora oleae]|uniref:Uncharacterized protein n=1 Tax=Phytophthora oleae TaxID=2107226 RepID=A0ABD3FE44_9STRA